MSKWTDDPIQRLLNMLKRVEDTASIQAQRLTTLIDQANAVVLPAQQPSAPAPDMRIFQAQLDQMKQQLNSLRSDVDYQSDSTFNTFVPILMFDTEFVLEHKVNSIGPSPYNRIKDDWLVAHLDDTNVYKSIVANNMTYELVYRTEILPKNHVVPAIAVNDPTVTLAGWASFPDAPIESAVVGGNLDAAYRAREVKLSSQLIQAVDFPENNTFQWTAVGQPAKPKGVAAVPGMADELIGKLPVIGEGYTTLTDAYGTMVDAVIGLWGADDPGTFTLGPGDMPVLEFYETPSHYVCRRLIHWRTNLGEDTVYFNSATRNPLNMNGVETGYGDYWGNTVTTKSISTTRTWTTPPTFFTAYLVENRWIRYVTSCYIDINDSAFAPYFTHTPKVAPFFGHQWPFGLLEVRCDDVIPRPSLLDESSSQFAVDGGTPVVKTVGPRENFDWNILYVIEGIRNILYSRPYAYFDSLWHPHV
jgi:hypothetical protein